MKKYLIALCMGLVGIGCFAQSKGESAVGATVGVAPSLDSDYKITNFGLGLKYQYNISDAVRVESDLDYWASDKSVGLVDFTGNVQYLFKVHEDINIYPTVGIGYAHVNGFQGDLSSNRFVFNVGLGGEYRCSDKISAFLEIKYQYIKNLSRLPINIGFTYHL